METIVKLDSLQPDLTFQNDLFLDKNYVLLPVTVPVTEELISVLKEWNFNEFITDGDLSLGGDIGVSQQEVKIESEEMPDESADKINASVKKILEESKNDKFANSDSSRMESVQLVYNEYMNYINSVYTYYATHKKISITELSNTVKELCIFIKDNKRFVLRVTPSVEIRSKNFLITHSMRSTVLAIAIGLELHLALSKLIELGITCILHEIGMLRLPPQLYITDRSLSPSEKIQVTTHTILGFNILKDLQFPLSIQLGVLEHHEKENGNGYPRRLTGAKISTYAKIISVACSFEAATAPREYKTERTAFDAMMEMLKNPNGQYDPTVIKALLYCISLFPIGVYVYLSNGKIGMVTDVVPNSPKNPIVQIINEKESDGSPKTVQTDEGSNKIVRVLSRTEQEDVIKSMKQMKTESKVQSSKITAEKHLAEEAEVKTSSSNNGFDEVGLEEFS